MAVVGRWWSPGVVGERRGSGRVFDMAKINNVHRALPTNALCAFCERSRRWTVAVVVRPSHTGVRFDTVTRGRSKSHAPGISVRKRRQASASVRDRTFPGCHRVTFRGNRVHLSAAANQLLVQKLVAKRGCPREPNHP